MKMEIKYHDFAMKNGEHGGLNRENQHSKQQKWWKLNQHDGFSHQDMMENDNFTIKHGDLTSRIGI